jgi:hypothetical protein
MYLFGQFFEVLGRCTPRAQDIGQFHRSFVHPINVLKKKGRKEGRKKWLSNRTLGLICLYNLGKKHRAWRLRWMYFFGQFFKVLGRCTRRAQNIGQIRHSFVRTINLLKKEGMKEGVVIKQDSRALLPVQLEAKAQCMATEMDLPFWAVFQGFGEMHPMPQDIGVSSFLCPSHYFVEEGRKGGRKKWLSNRALGLICLYNLGQKPRTSRLR